MYSKDTAAHTWSLIDHRPVITYLPHHDDYIVHWNGIAMSHSMALIIAMTAHSIYPTFEMKTAAEKNHIKLYYEGAFGHRNWDSFFRDYRSSQTTHGLYRYLQTQLQLHINHHIFQKSTPIVETLSWFDYSRCITDD